MPFFIIAKHSILNWFLDPNVMSVKGGTPLHAAAKSVHDSADNTEVSLI